jgi:translocation and assembly module TamB
VIATVGVILMGVILLVMVAIATDLGREILAKLVSRAVSSPASQISIGKIEGQLASDFAIHDIAIGDQQGAWLNVDRVHIRWKPLALLRLQLSIDTLDVNQVEVLRKPVAGAHENSPANAEPLILPRPPVSIAVGRASVANLIVDAPLLGIPARFSATVTANLAPQGLGFTLDGERLDRPAKLAARIDFAPDDKALRTSLYLDEPAGGVLAEIASLPDRPPVTVTLDGDGTLDAFRAKLAFHAGPAIGTEGTLMLDKEGTVRNLALDLAAQFPSLSFERMRAKVKIAPNDAAANLYDLRAEAETTGLQVRDTALGEAIGQEIKLTMKGSGSLDGLSKLESLRVASRALSADFKGEAGTGKVKGRLDAEIPNLSRFGKLAGLPLRGRLKLGADLDGTPSERRFAAMIDATTSEFATGLMQIDGLIGGEARLTGGVNSAPDTGLSFDNLTLSASQARVQINGAANPKAADITALLTIPSLEKADKRLAGHGEAKAHVTGTLDHPNATLSAEIHDGALLGRPVPRLILAAHGTDLLDAFDAEANLDGSIGGKPAQGSAHFARLSGNEIRLDPLDVKVGSVTATGTVTVDPSQLASGKLTLRGHDLDDLSPLLLEKLTGTIDADLTFTRDGGRQGISIAATGRRVAGFGMGFAKLSADLTATDVYQRPAVTGSAEVSEAPIGSETIKRLRLDAKGAAGASDVTLTASMRGIDAEARGRIVSSNLVQLDLSELDARRGSTRIGLAGPASFTREDKTITIRNLALLTNGGRLSVDGRAGPNSDLNVRASAVPLSAADLVAPELGLAGTLDGEATIVGPLAAPTGTYHLRLANLTTTQTKTSGLPPIGAEASGSLDGSRTRLDAKITAGEAGRATVTGTVPLASDGTLDLAVKGTLDAGIAGRAMAAQGRHVTGTVAIDGHMAGQLDKPQTTGTILFSNGSFQDADLGTRFDAIHAKVVAQGDKITIENASAAPRSGGALTLSGEVHLDPPGGFPGSIKIVGQRAEIVRSPIATAIVDVDLAITGPLAQNPRIGGKVGIETLDISIAEQLPGSAKLLEGARHIRATPTARRRLALGAESKGPKGANPFNAALDVLVDVPGRIRVTGRGLDAELGGKVKVLGPLTEPKPEGAFHLVQGKMQILTTQLDFTRANLTFAGDLSPQLDFLGTTQAGGASIRVAATGKPNDPQFSFSSSPDYPQDEILSRLLFGQAAGNLTPTQALALTQAVAIYSGGSSALEGLRRSLGLGDATQSSDPLSDWLGNRVSLGVRTGATPAQTGIGVDVSIWRNLKARGTIDAKGGASAGVGAETEW